MTNEQFAPPPARHPVEIMIDGKTHKGSYHLEHENLVVSYQGGSKMAPQSGDNATQAKSMLGEIVAAKHGRH
jgi:hypothetical protein